MLDPKNELEIRAAIDAWAAFGLRTPRSGNSASQVRSTYGCTWAISHTSGCRNSDRFGISAVVTPGMQGAGKVYRNNRHAGSRQSGIWSQSARVSGVTRIQDSTDSGIQTDSGIAGSAISDERSGFEAHRPCRPNDDETRLGTPSDAETRLSPIDERSSDSATSAASQSPRPRPAGSRPPARSTTAAFLPAPFSAAATASSDGSAAAAWARSIAPTT